MRRTQLEEIARGAGFDAVGIARAVGAPHADAFREWLAEGCHATMDWLAHDSEKRCDPALLLPGARSVIVLGMNSETREKLSRGARAPGKGYFRDPDGSFGNGAVRGRIAGFARGRDYHRFISKRLRVIARALAAEGGSQRCFVDSGPILERDFAVLAGMAWHGKSGAAVHPEFGARLLLATVVTTLELEPDAPLRDRCGKCVRCIEACPTAAITAPHKVDARRCVAYWTIEHKGPMPEWIRPLLGDRIFGCDDCLDACPWNRFAEASREADFAARASSRWPLRDYLRLDEEGFRKLFEGSPIRRAGRQGFLRNVCTALGNVGAVDDLPTLEKARLGGDPVVAEHATWAIGQIRALFEKPAHFRGTLTGDIPRNRPQAPY